MSEREGEGGEKKKKISHIEKFTSHFMARCVRRLVDVTAISPKSTVLTPTYIFGMYFSWAAKLGKPIHETGNTAMLD